MKMNVEELNAHSGMNSLVNKTSNSTFVEELVKIERLTAFCARNKIEKIDYVKIDTEGYDLEVLNGGSDLLKADKISFIETEVSMNPENTNHVKFEVIKKFLEEFNYRLFGIYEQVQEWPTSKPVLRRINALFVAKTIYSNENTST